MRGKTLVAVSTTALVVASLLSACGGRTSVLLSTTSDESGSPADQCPDGGTSPIFIVTQNALLYSFYPPTAAFTLIGAVNCPNTIESVWSMAVDRAGTAYVLFNEGTAGSLYAVDTTTAACRPLPFAPGQDGFDFFGMGFATNGAGPSETLYIQADDYENIPGSSVGLASLDPTTWEVTPIGAANPPFAGGELTGTGAGDLYVFYFYETDVVGAHLGKLDKSTGELLSTVDLPTIDVPGESFAMAYWGGNFYLFTDGTVSEYSPATGVAQVVATLDDNIVGAGVSTCAPQ